MDFIKILFTSLATATLIDISDKLSQIILLLK